MSPFSSGNWTQAAQVHTPWLRQWWCQSDSAKSFQLDQEEEEGERGIAQLEQGYGRLIIIIVDFRQRRSIIRLLHIAIIAIIIVMVNVISIMGYIAIGYILQRSIIELLQIPRWIHKLRHILLHHHHDHHHHPHQSLVIQDGLSCRR